MNILYFSSTWVSQTSIWNTYQRATFGKRYSHLKVMEYGIHTKGLPFERDILILKLYSGLFISFGQHEIQNFWKNKNCSFVYLWFRKKIAARWLKAEKYRDVENILRRNAFLQFSFWFPFSMIDVTFDPRSYEQIK